tara:strand:+ start:3364 stop:3657 length:294 start_codon:yes stop_codon:yes gene_type:complete
MRIDRRIDCRHCYRNDIGLRVCVANRVEHPTQQTCGVCKYRDPRRDRRGLGDWLEWLIDKVTGGRAKPAAEAIAKKTGKTECGCAKRKAALNRIGGN